MIKLSGKLFKHFGVFFLSGADAAKLIKQVAKLTGIVNDLKQKNRKLTLEHRSLQSKSQARKLVSSELEKYFTPRQTKKIISQKRVTWSEEDIVKGLMICSLSKKTYQFIRKKNLFPLPAISTLRKWVSRFECLPGILSDVLTILKKQITAEANGTYKLGVLAFDEVELKKKYEYFQKQDCVFPAHKKAQVAMIRGLCSNWKQPIFFDFDTPMQENLLKEIIIKVEETGIEVWAMTSDGGSTNQALLKKLGITTDNTSFTNPADPTRKIYVFVDVPHLLKLIGNHILDAGIQVDGKNEILGQSDFWNILRHNQTEFNITHKLTEFHLTCSGPQRQRVRPAAQLLSHQTATALRCLDETKTPQANFIELVNNW
jgi:hypothetical protein